MYCAHCGKELVEGANFCSTCGARAGAAGRVAAAEGLPGKAPEATGGVSAALASSRSRSRLHMPPIILLALALALTAGIAAAAYYVYTEVYLPSAQNHQAAYAPDQEVEFSEPLRSALLPQVDTNGDGRIVYSEVESTTSIALSNPGITDISELAVFKRLTTLDINGSGVVNADVSNMASLESLAARETPLGSLNVSGDVALASITCPDETNVTGLESTELVEHWLITNYYFEGMTSAQIQQGVVYPVTSSSMLFAYDDDGKLIEKTTDLGNDYYQPEGRRETSYRYEYNTDAQCVSSSSTSGITISCSYANGRLSNVVRQSPVSTTTTTYIYDDQGRVIEIDNGDSGYSQTYSYDASGNMVNCNGVTCEYENGKLVHASSNAGTDFPSDTYYGYDSAGRWTSVQSTSMLFPHTDTWAYDDDGHLTWARRTYDSSVFEDWTASFMYDNHGNLAERTLTYTGDRTSDDADGFYSGIARFAYTRVFTEKDAVGVRAPDWEPIDLGDPISGAGECEPWNSTVNVINGPMGEYGRRFPAYA